MAFLALSILVAIAAVQQAFEEVTAQTELILVVLVSALALEEVVWVL